MNLKEMKAEFKNSNNLENTKMSDAELKELVEYQNNYFLKNISYDAHFIKHTMKLMLLINGIGIVIIIIILLSKLGI